MCTWWCPRAMAVRFSGQFTSRKPVAELIGLVAGSMTDPDPFVRKVAMLASARLYVRAPDLGEKAKIVEVRGLL
jgi:vesicle coat complex subunit